MGYDDLLRNGERKILLTLVGQGEGQAIGPNSERSGTRLVERGYIAKRPDPSRRYVITDAGRAWIAATISDGIWDQWLADPTERQRWIKARDVLTASGHPGLPAID